MSFSPNLKVLTDWRSSLNVAFSVLRRIKFIIEDNFSFGDFNPQLNYGGMTVTSPLIYRARYLKIFKIMWFSIDVTATLAAPFTFQIVATLPATTAGDSSSYQGFCGVGQNTGAGEIILSQTLGTTNSLFIYRGNATPNFTAGVWRARINGFIEVI